MFADKIYLVFLLILPLLALFFAISYKKRKSALSAFFSSTNLSSLSNVNLNAYKIKYALWIAAFFFLILALARPQFGENTQEVIRESSEIVVALDISRSMLSRDIEPSRLEKAKQILFRVIEENAGDKIGVIVFSGTAMWQCPMTYDFEALKIFLGDIQTGVLPVGGTQISAAIMLAVKAVGANPSNNKVLLLISDGEDHDSKIDAALKEANDISLRILTVGIGSQSGSPIPMGDSAVSDYIRDEVGNVVMSRLNPQLLKTVAQKTNGEYFDASQRDLFSSLIKSIRNIEKDKSESAQRTNKAERFQIFLFLALLALFAEFLIPITSEAKI
ncbi:MAG: VWA domain-containing protein [Elusimicrobiota bacterium]|jgi:Ca-activated chloride channel family protein|nr:VWA domain-containing protein [Elusimicrobiota bacterium]